jgi:hypothetical protein
MAEMTKAKERREKMEENINSFEPEIEQELSLTEEVITEEIPTEELEASQEDQGEPEIIEISENEG